MTIMVGRCVTTILVTGATGNVGRHAVSGLAAAGVAVRAFSRGAGTAGFGDGVTAVGGDLTDPAALGRALSGVDAVLLAWPFLTTDGAPAVLDVLARHVRRVVYLSSSAVVDDGDQSDAITRLHAGMEALVRAGGPEPTVLRCDTVAGNALGWAGQVRATGMVRGPAFAPTAVVDEADVAAVAVRALTDDAHAGTTHVLTGPQVLTRADQARLIGEAIGRPVRFEEVPLGAARARLIADGRPPALVDALMSSARDRPASTLVTDTVQRITGAPARTFGDWAAAHAAAFR